MAQKGKGPLLKKRKADGKGETRWAKFARETKVGQKKTLRPADVAASKVESSKYNSVPAGGSSGGGLLKGAGGNYRESTHLHLSG